MFERMPFRRDGWNRCFSMTSGLRPTQGGGAQRGLLRLAWTSALPLSAMYGLTPPELPSCRANGGPLALHDGDVLVHVDGKYHDRQFSAIWTAKGAPAAPTEAAMWAADIRQNAQICVWVVKPVRCRTHARGDARLKEQIASVARAAIGQRRRAGNLDFPAVLAIALHGGVSTRAAT